MPGPLIGRNPPIEQRQHLLGREFAARRANDEGDRNLAEPAVRAADDRRCGDFG
jgi:hypothetical protein